MPRCLVCEHEQQAGDSCDNCGVAFPKSALEATPVEAPVVSILQAAPSEQPRAYGCLSCGQPTTEVLCPTCGIRVRPRKTEAELSAAGGGEGAVACKSCGHVTTATMCPHCGVRIIR